MKKNCQKSFLEAIKRAQEEYQECLLSCRESKLLQAPITHWGDAEG